MTTRQTLRDYLTSIGSTATSISIPVEPGSNGIVDQGDDLGVEPNTERELLDFKSGESLLGDYLSYVTRKNDYPIAPGVHEAVSPVQGSALSTAETTSATVVFSDSRVGTNAESLNRSNSMRFDASGQPLTTIIDKLGNGTASSGNELLASTVSAAASSDNAPNQTKAVKGAFSSLKKYNYYSPTSSPSNFAKDDYRNNITPQEFESTRKSRFQIGEGEYSIETSEIAAEITLDELSNIARSMILKSAGWDKTTLPGDASDPNSAFVEISEATLARFPEFVRDNLGVVDAFRAQDSYSFPTNPDGTSFLADRGDVLNKDYNEATYTKSRGGTHTADQTFGESPNSDNRIQSLQAGLSMIGLAALIDKKMVNIQQIVKDLQNTNDTVLRGPYYLGRSTKSDLEAKTRALVRTFMIETGIFTYEKCVAEGLYSCFGYDPSVDRVALPTDDASASNIASSYGNLIKKIANDLDKPFYASPMGLSQGFWRAVAESAIRTIKNIRKSTQQNDGVDYVRCLLEMKDSLVVKVMNVFASIGYQRLIIQGISTSELESGEQPQNPYGIDDYPLAPGTRQMKSRDGQILNRSSLAWRISALPSAFILPIEAMTAALDANYMFDATKGSNPIKGMLGSTLYDKTYVKSTRNAGAIPPEVAKALEDRLGSEYMPFYFRDLRTNEIVAFHAFLENFSDSFTANYNETKGFGRTESVYNYSNTGRSFNFNFWIVATSKEDFDEMWFKVNKLTTLVYPQYTRGRSVSSKDTGTLTGGALKQTINFEQPFSQLVGGTPVVRIRIGDLIKTNYTRSNFGRLFGVGNDTFNAYTDQFVGLIPDAFGAGSFITKRSPVVLALLPFLAYAGSPMELTQFSSLVKTVGGGSGALLAGSTALASLSSDLLVNGFVNPLLYNDRNSLIKTSNLSAFFESIDIPGEGVTEFLKSAGLRSKVILKPRSTPYQVTKNGVIKNLRLLRPIFVSTDGSELTRTGPAYQVTIDDNTLSEELRGSVCTVSAADLYIDSGRIVDITSFPGLLLAAGLYTSAGGAAAQAGVAGLGTLISENGSFNSPVDVPLDDLVGSLGKTFVAPENNPITKAFEDRMGEGLAGVIKSLSFAWDASVWETDWNSRAPQMCKVTVNFSPIHDIAPGLDSNGFNRAPIYNVGQIMHDTFGHSREDGGVASKFFYKQGGAVAESAAQPTWQQKNE